MALTFRHDSTRTPEQLQAVLQDPRFVSDYAKQTKAVREEVTVRGDEVALVRANRTEGVPGFLKPVVGEEVEVHESSTWEQLASREQVFVDIGGRRGRLEGRSTITARDGGSRYEATGDITLEGVPGLVKGKVEQLVERIIVSAMTTKLELSDTWS